MCTKESPTVGVHDSVNHYHSSYKAFMNYLKILNGLELQVRSQAKKRVDSFGYGHGGKELT
jgi:hypothetical protein